MTATDREARLPRWAQDELRQLRSEVARLKDQLQLPGVIPYDDAMDAYGSTDPVMLDGKALGYQHLALTEPDLRVSYRWPGETPHDRRTLDIRREGSGLQVMSSRGLIVRPHVSNVVHLEVDPR